MKKNGFIATSLMFSFFIIFLTMTLMIMATYTQYQSLVNSLNNNVLNDLNDNVIIGKYTTLYNSIIDGDFDSVKNEAFNSTAWTNLSNATPLNDTEQFSAYMRLNPTTSSFGQYINNTRLLKKRDTNSKIYVRYNIFRNYTIKCEDTPSEVNDDAPYLQIGTRKYYLHSNLCGTYSQWEMYSEVLDIKIDSDTQYIGFGIDNMKSGRADITEVSTLHVNIDNVMVIDITDAIKTGSNHNTIKSYLDANLSTTHETFLWLDRGYPIQKR